jgi:hypothetical protein
MSDRKLETLHNGKLHNLYSLPSIISMIRKGRIRLAGHVARMGEKRIAYMVGKSEGKKTTRKIHM